MPDFKLNEEEKEKMLVNEIPPLYQEVKTEEIPPKLLERLLAAYKEGKGLFIHGAAGIGKTHYLYALKRRRNEKEVEAKEKGKILMGGFTIKNFTSLLHEIKSEIGEGGPQALLEWTADDEGVLAIDDVGSEKMSEWVEETLYYILNTRYEKCLPTIITSNYSIQELSGRIGDRNTSRIIGMCEIIELNGKDKRLEKVKKTTIEV